MEARVVLTLKMPPRYPEEDLLEILGTLEEASNSEIEKLAWNALPSLLESCRNVAKDIIGEEAILAIFTCAAGWIEDEWPLEVNLSTSMLPNKKNISKEIISSRSHEASKNNLTMGRRLIYSHHIIASSKRTVIRDLASHFHLTGRVKIGWPGIILIEGKEEDCLEFIDQIRPMSWQYLVVRGEQQEQVSNEANLEKKRKFDSFYEMEDMSTLAKQCKEAGLEKLFRTSMKIYDSEKAASEEEDATTHSYGALIHVDHMNNGKSYRKWLRKSSRETRCSLLLVKQFFPNNDYTNRAVIIVGIIGTRDNVQEFLKRWRTSRVDVDSKGRPCLERKMSVLHDGKVENASCDLQEVNCCNEEDQTNTTLDNLSNIVSAMFGGKEWLEALQRATKSMF
mmetsp:Transcript_17643/g.24532  ORF Transcript_17643/g.24532 Transcript_17643/m.24532 type:complete len:394 (+) Transcript_17643:421-1602(+)